MSRSLSVWGANCFLFVAQSLVSPLSAARAPLVGVRGHSSREPGYRARSFGFASPSFVCEIVQTTDVPVGFLVVIIVFGTWCVLATGGAVVGMALEQKAVAADPTGIRYRLQSGPTGIPWVTAFNLDAGWITLPVHRRATGVGGHTPGRSL